MRPQITCTHEGIQLVDDLGNEACWDCGGVVHIEPEHPPGHRKLAAVREPIVQAIREGVSPGIAAMACGVARTTWKKWMSSSKLEHITFQQAVREAEATAVAECLRRVKTSDPKVWLKHATELEGAWREPTKQVNVAVGGSGVPIQVGPAPAIDLSRLTNEQLADLDRLLAQAQGQGAPAPAQLPAHDDAIDAEWTDE